LLPHCAELLYVPLPFGEGLGWGVKHLPNFISYIKTILYENNCLAPLDKLKLMYYICISRFREESLLCGNAPFIWEEPRVSDTKLKSPSRMVVNNIHKSIAAILS
jgi:hypothetical protein